MAADDLREYITFYGIHTNDWKYSWGSYFDHHKILNTEYISDGCDCEDSSSATDLTNNVFIYMHHIKKKYFIEGVIEGHVTFAASGCTATIYAYRVSIGRINQATGTEELYTTNWVTVDDTLGWDSGLSVGEEIVYPFWIDAWEKATLDEFDRIYIKVETDIDTCTDTSCSCCVLMHSNDPEWEDLKVTIPFRFGG
jgi:hypothetical protein